MTKLSELRNLNRQERRLIMSLAPDLLQALIEIAQTPCGQAHAKQVARAAINKATHE